jgi:uncharacterized protein
MPGFIAMEQLIFVAPALLLAMWAQHRVKHAYVEGLQHPAQLTGAQTARVILDHAGLQDVAIEQVPGQMSDHYDPSHRVVRLSRDVFHGHTATSVGIAAHEVGHAIQHATHYGPLVVRNLAVPLAQIGSAGSSGLLIAGVAMQSGLMVTLAIIAFGLTVAFQLINLPVEFDASNRARKILGQMGVVDSEGAGHVNSVLSAAAWTYVAATLSAVLNLLWLVLAFSGNRRSDER